MVTLPPQNTAVLVIEEYGFRSYINLVADPANPLPRELGEGIAVDGPMQVSHQVHYHMDEISAQPLTRHYDFLDDEEVQSVVDCTRQHRRDSVYKAMMELDLDTRKGVGIELYEAVDSETQRRMRVGLVNGQFIPETSAAKEAGREETFNLACSGTEWNTRYGLLYDLVLEGRITREQYDAARPTYSEIASICTDVHHRVDEGESLYNAWHGELYSLGKHAGYVYGVITGEAVADNDFALKHMCSKLTIPRTDLAPVLCHFEYLRDEYVETFFEEKDEGFNDLAMNAEIIARAPYMGSDAADDEAFEFWQRLMPQLDEE